MKECVTTANDCAFTYVKCLRNPTIVSRLTHARATFPIGEFYSSLFANPPPEESETFLTQPATWPPHSVVEAARAGADDAPICFDEPRRRRGRRRERERESAPLSLRRYSTPNRIETITVLLLLLLLSLLFRDRRKLWRGRRFSFLSIDRLKQRRWRSNFLMGMTAMTEAICQDHYELAHHRLRLLLSCHLRLPNDLYSSRTTKKFASI